MKKDKIEKRAMLFRKLEAIDEAIHLTKESKKLFELLRPSSKLKHRTSEFKEVYEDRVKFVNKHEEEYLKKMGEEKTKAENEIKKIDKAEKKNKAARDRRAAKKAAMLKDEAARKHTRKKTTKKKKPEVVTSVKKISAAVKGTVVPKPNKKLGENPNIDVCITFDTTGSMYPCLTQVRRSVKEVVSTLFKDIPDLRISIIAHGDYEDARRTYVTKTLDFTKDMNSIINFVSNVGPTCGFDAPECYELVLNEARTKLSWKSGRSKVIVMIGDDVPHGTTYHLNTKNIDWRNELGLLLEANINVYGVHAMPGCRRHSKPFYTEIAKKTGGFYLTLDQFSSITDLIMGICYRQDDEKGFVEFAAQLKRQGKMSRGLANSFKTMSGEPSSDFSESYDSVFGDYSYSYKEDGLIPVPAGRFQVIPVSSESKIREFIEDQGVTYKAGRGFYELVRHGKKRYKVQQYKEIILMDRESGDVFNGSEPRKLLGLRPRINGGRGSGVVENIAPKSLDKYRVFIQSTSYTRKLVPGSSLLYEVPDWDSKATCHPTY